MDALARLVLKRASAAIEERGIFTLALSGGSLPRLLSAIASPEFTNSLCQLDKWHVFFADERCVALDHPDSNYLACKTALFDRLPNLKPSQIHSIDTKLVNDPDAAANAYQRVLQTVVGSMVLDVVLLGMGPDGHTCSLFPNHALLSETERWVAHITDSPKPPSNRITLTLPVVNSARFVAFVCTGKAKAQVIHDIMDSKSTEYPSALVNPTNGELVWLLDQPAASLLLLQPSNQVKL